MNPLILAVMNQMLFQKKTYELALSAVSISHNVNLIKLDRMYKQAMYVAERS